ncbi:catalase [Mucilaginibacter sp.]|uniref:catalase n=1 Tax=Mucilaginibacter sp. TaxID=1882438 RepID=UPI003B008ABB
MENKNQQNRTETNKKLQDLEQDTSYVDGKFLTTNQGLKVNDDHNSLKAGERGPTLLEDFILREKIFHFDHERIPERVVHARGAGAHGYFQVYDDSLKKYTKAGFLTDPSRKTPIFARFSTVGGSRGSTDLARDVRGFAVKFYTEEGIYDFVGNNIPVFFIQDAINFPDLIHAVKPEPHNEIPQAASAHDTFYDFISLMPESLHMLMWIMSDRAIPRSLRMMEGFNVHTWRLINEEGKSVFVKFHWKPLLGVHSVAWDEAQKISGKNSDFHRLDLWEAIENGDFPEWELGFQIIPEEDEHKFGFDLLDATKLVPEELVPVQRFGKMVLNRNPDSYFAETEQVAFHPGHIVPGLDFTNDPLLQGRLFSYTDTQLSRLGSPNFHEIPINRSIAPIINNQRDGHMRQTINSGRTAYEPNKIANGSPNQAKVSEGGFTSYQERIEAAKIRARSASFRDHFSQATLFFNSQSEPEQNHIIDALSFELGKVELDEIVTRMLGLLNQISNKLASKVADKLGMDVPAEPLKPINFSHGADADMTESESVVGKSSVQKSEALSMAKIINPTIKTRQIAFLVANGFDGEALSAMKTALTAEGAMVKIVSPKGGKIKCSKGNELKVDQSFLQAASVLFDAVYVPGGKNSVDMLIMEGDALHFVDEAYRHCKAIAADKEAVELLKASYLGKKVFAANPDEAGLVNKGLILNQAPAAFVTAIGKHRFWEREKPEEKFPA